MKEARVKAGCWVNAKLKIAFAVVAANTRKTEITQRCCPAGRQRNNMVDLHDDHEFLLRPTILALSSGALVDLMPNVIGDASHSLYRGLEIQVDVMSPLLQ